MQNGTRSRKSSGKDNEIEFNFLIICRYLNFVKNQSLQPFKCKNRLIKLWEKIYVIFSALYMKGDIFACFKGK